MSVKAKREKRKQSAARRRAMKATDGSLPYRMPEGFTRFKKKEGKSTFDILGFKAGKNNPDADEGEWVDSRVYFAHKNVGGSDDMVICPLKTAGKKCPCCEMRAKEASKKDGDDELIKSLKPQKRQAIMLKPKGSDELELYDDAEYNFGKRLNADLANCDESEGNDEYFRHTKKAGGKTIRAQFAEMSGGDFSYTGCNSVKFLEREEELEKDVLEKVVCLDDVINAAIPSYEDLKKKLTLGDKDNEDEDDEDEDDTSEDEDDDEEDSDDDEEEVKIGKGDVVKSKKKYKGKHYKGKVKKIVNGLCHVVDEDDKLYVESPENLELVKKAKSKDEDEDEGEEDDEDESESKGKSSKKSGKSSKSSSKKASKDDDEDEDDEDEDDVDEEEEEDEEEEKPKKKNKKKKSKDEDEEEEDEDDDIPFEDDEEEEEDDDEDEEEEEEEKPNKKKKK